LSIIQEQKSSFKMSKIKRKEMCSPIVLYLIIGLYETNYEDKK